MQAKISSFFKPTGNSASRPPRESDLVGERELERSNLDVSLTYSRRNPNLPIGESEGNKTIAIDGPGMKVPSKTGCSGKLLNKKRSYAQYHLELGQSDFLLHSCSVCGMMYTCGEESDEKAHKVYHKNYYEGIQFKGWHNERPIPMPWTDGERVVLVLDGDPPFQKRKVQEVLKFMERDLGLCKEWLLHKLCKVFLFIARNRIVACLVAEPIKTAYRVIPRVGSSKTIDEKDDNASKSASFVTEDTTLSTQPSSAILQFGRATFYREGNKKSSSKVVAESSWDDGALLCSEEPVDAICGIRAIWVVSSLRRHKIATRLLDTTRRTFVEGTLLETIQYAFSQPTSAGRALAVSYTGTPSFLVYKPQ